MLCSETEPLTGQSLAGGASPLSLMFESEMFSRKGQAEAGLSPLGPSTVRMDSLGASPAPLLCELTKH